MATKGKKNQATSPWPGAFDKLGRASNEKFMTFQVAIGVAKAVGIGHAICFSLAIGATKTIAIGQAIGFIRVMGTVRFICVNIVVHAQYVTIHYS